MLSKEAPEFLRKVFELFSEASRIPIALFERDGKGSVKETIRTEKYFPSYCHEIWKLADGKGKKMCDQDMCQRSEKTYRNGKESLNLCHAGLTNVSQPVIVDGKSVAVLQYGSFRIKGEKEQKVAARIARHKQAMKRLKVDEKEAKRLEELLMEKAPEKSPAQWKKSRNQLPPILAQIIYEHISQFEKTKTDRRNADHDMQIRIANTIAASENILSEIDPGSPIKEGIEDVWGSAKSCVVVMHNLTRGEFLPKEYRFKPKPMAELIDETIILVRAQAKLKGVDIVREYQHSNRKDKVDVSLLHIEVALNNIFHNAVKYSYYSTEYTDRYMTIRGRSSPNYYELIITNFGIGIELDEIEKVFDPGYQGRLTEKEYRGGSGEGLGVAKSIIVKHAGKIILESNPLSGDYFDEYSRPYLTTCRVILPKKQPIRSV